MKYYYHYYEYTRSDNLEDTTNYEYLLVASILVAGSQRVKYRAAHK